jgi:PAS domain S-box-containing protein
MIDRFVADVINENHTVEAGLQLEPGLIASSRLPRLLDDVRARYPMMASYAIARTDGTFLASSPLVPPGTVVSDRDYFRKVTTGAPWAVSDLLVSRLTGQPAFAIASLLRDASGNVSGVIVATIDVSQLHHIFPTSLAAGELTIVDSNGRMVFDSRHETVNWQKRDWSKLDLVRRALAGEQASSRSFDSPITGERLMGSFVPAETVPWVAGSIENYDRAMEPVNAWSAAILMGAALAAVASILLVWLLGVYVTQPIRELTRAARAYSGAGPMVRVRVRSGDETEELAASLNAMGSRIVEREDQLRDYVERNEVLADAAEARAAELETVIERLPTGIVIVDGEGRIIRSNVHAGDLYGIPLTPGVLMRERTSNVILFNADGEPYTRDDMPISRAISTGVNVMDEEVIVERSPGDRNVLLVSAAPIRNDEGEIIGAVGVMQDISERKAIEEHERTIAEMLQDSLAPAIPSELNGLSVASIYVPALEEARVGGDFLDVFSLDDRRVAITIGDVSGKGLEAAQMVAMIKFYLRGYAYEHPDDPDVVMNELARALLIDKTEDKFVTVFYGVVDTENHTVSYASAGHEPPILLRESGLMEDLMPTGVASGVIDTLYSIQDAALRPTDHIVLYTDGATEARSPDGNMLGIDGLKSIVADAHGSAAGEIVEAIYSGVTEFAGGKSADDFTLLVVGWR